MNKQQKVKRSLASLAGVLVALSLVLGLTGCHSKKVNVTKIGILQLVQHDSLDDIREGFIAKLAAEGYVDGENIQIDYLNASNDQANLNSMSERLVRENDLVFAIATRAAQTVVNMKPDIPVIFGAVTDPVDAKLVEALDKPGEKVTGASDLAPIAQQIRLLLSLKPGIDKVGLLYNTSEPNSVVQINIAKATLAAAGVEAVEMTVTSTNEVPQMAQNLIARVDGVFVPTDNTVATAIVLIGEMCKEAKIPLVPAWIEEGDTGGVATVGIDYVSHGEICGEMAVQVLKGAAPSAMPVRVDNKATLVINEVVAEAIGIDPATITLPES